jgi:hypothetical protein
MMKILLICCIVILVVMQTSYAQDKKVIYAEEHDVYSYTSVELKDILNLYPELQEEITRSPDEVYARRSLCLAGNDRRYSSEAGQDEYYILYAFYLKQKNGEAQYQKQRDRLIAIYRIINNIYAELSGGGTYFGHQYRRIVGYVEYAIYVQNDNEYYNRSYDYTLQKKLYIDMLKQYIADEVAANNDIIQVEKVNFQKRLFDAVEKLDKTITSFSDLKSAQQFQYSHY